MRSSAVSRWMYTLTHAREAHTFSAVTGPIFTNLNFNGIETKCSPYIFSVQWLPVYHSCHWISYTDAAVPSIRNAHQNTETVNSSIGRQFTDTFIPIESFLHTSQNGSLHSHHPPHPHIPISQHTYTNIHGQIDSAVANAKHGHRTRVLCQNANATSAKSDSWQTFTVYSLPRYFQQIKILIHHVLHADEIEHISKQVHVHKISTNDHQSAGICVNRCVLCVVCDGVRWQIRTTYERTYMYMFLCGIRGGVAWVLVCSVLHRWDAFMSFIQCQTSTDRLMHCTHLRSFASIGSCICAAVFMASWLQVKFFSSGIVAERWSPHVIIYPQSTSTWSGEPCPTVSPKVYGYYLHAFIGRRFGFSRSKHKPNKHQLGVTKNKKIKNWTERNAVVDDRHKCCVCSCQWVMCCTIEAHSKKRQQQHKKGVMYRAANRTHEFNKNPIALIVVSTICWALLIRCNDAVHMHCHHCGAENTFGKHWILIKIKIASIFRWESIVCMCNAAPVWWQACQMGDERPVASRPTWEFAFWSGIHLAICVYARLSCHNVCWLSDKLFKLVLLLMADILYTQSNCYWKFSLHSSIHYSLLSYSTHTLTENCLHIFVLNSVEEFLVMIIDLNCISMNTISEYHRHLALELLIWK